MIKKPNKKNKTKYHWPELFGKRKHLISINGDIYEGHITIEEEKVCKCFLCLSRSMNKLLRIMNAKETHKEI